MKAITVLLLGLAFASAGAAATFEDLDGGFVIDLPDGYEETGRVVNAGVSTLTLTHAQGPRVTLVVVPIETGFDGPAELLESQVAGVQEGIGGQIEVRELDDFDLGANPARWGWMTGRASGVAVEVGVGAVEMDDAQLGFMTLMPQTQLAAWGEDLEAAFLTARPIGAPRPVVTNKVAATSAAGGEPELTPPSTYAHALFTLDLPAGWSATTNSEDPRAINMASLAGPEGASGIVMCLSGFGASRKAMDGATRSSLTANLPNVRHVSNSSLETASGSKASINVFQGQTEAEGRTVVLDGLTASVKHGKCWLGFIGFGAPAASSSHLEDLRWIVQSVR